MSLTKYVTCFPGARDAYQLPYALYENGRLDLFITDVYNKGVLKNIPLSSFRNKLKNRAIEGDVIPHQFIRISPEVILKRKVFDMFNHPAVASVKEDDAYAKLAVDAARKFRSGLFLYEFQAEYAFKQKLSHNPPRHVYYFHPNPTLEHPILLNDAKNYPSFMDEVMANTRQSFSQRFRDHTKNAWRNADHIFVASSFTKKSLLHAGADEERITVAPYGVVLPESFRDKAPGGEPYFLFVGAGSHRKGLHHLLEAWKKSGLGEKGKLIVVSRVADKFNTQLLVSTPGVEWKRGVSRPELVDLYSNASLFVLPSMSEGFGHVYLEALHFGCPVLGTDHSILADIESDDQAIQKVEPANIDELANKLATLWLSQPGRDLEIRRKATVISKAFTWTRFHNTIENKLKEFDA